MKKAQAERQLRSSDAAHSHDSSVKSIRKAVRILSILGENTFGLRLGEIADRLEIPKPSAHRILTTLEDVKYVRYEPMRKCWQLSSAAALISPAYKPHSS